MIVEFLKTNKEKKKGKKDSDLFTAGYFTAGGLITGFLIASLWEKFDTQGFDSKIDRALITGKQIENSKSVKLSKFVMMSLSTLLMLSELFGVKGGVASGSGMLLGYTYANASHDGKYVGEV